MPSFKKYFSQGSINASTEVVIPTSLTVDGKTGFNIVGVHCLIFNAGAAIVPTVDCLFGVQVNTEVGSQLPDDPDQISYQLIQTTGIAASTSSYQVNGYLEDNFPVGRLTVQPNLYIRLDSVGLAAPATVLVTIFYEIVKLTDLEVMRLMQGGA